MTTREKLMENLLQTMSTMRHRLMVGYHHQKRKVITPSQACVLRFVAENPTVNVKTIAETLHITSSAATQLISSLVKKGYLLQKITPEDRRVRALFLSPKANKLFNEFKAQGLKKMEVLFKPLTDEELAQYAALNQKIADSIPPKS